MNSPRFGVSRLAGFRCFLTAETPIRKGYAAKTFEVDSTNPVFSG
jgi:hypothetical protein